MQYISSYKLFENRQIPPYDIYEFRMKAFNYTRGSSNNTSFLDWTDHFIGQGFFNEMKSHFDKVYNALSQADTHYIKHRIYTIEDELDMTSWVAKGIGYKNGMTTVSEENGSYDKNYIYANIINHVLMPTLGNYGKWRKDPGSDIVMRDDNDKILISDEKWDCTNFFKQEEVSLNMLKYDRLRMIDGVYWDKWSPFDIFKYKNPMIFIRFGEWETRLRKTFSWEKIETLIRENLIDQIYQDLDVKEIIWNGYTEEDVKKRSFDQSGNIYDYTLKIILNF